MIAMGAVVEARELQELEVRLLLSALADHYGYDFRNYARASLLRRIRNAVEREGVPTISHLQATLLHQPASMHRFIDSLAVQVTAMFRDADFYRTVRETVLPLLRTYPFIRIWHAGCSSGEEVYSMAILLHEAGLYQRARIYATDISATLLERAERGIFPLSSMREHTLNYQRAGGTGDFSAYYTADHENALFRDFLRHNIVFSQHNLACDGPFNEFNLIFCRNVMIYFDPTLRDRAHGLFYESLARFGLLALGLKETVAFTPFETRYEALSAEARIYRRKS
jgi:chemotaxis protein methyltransferase CheR